MFVHKPPRFNDLSEVAVVDFSNEACARSAYVLDVLYRGGSPKINKVILESLQNWSAAADCFEKLPAPTPLVKQWVKVKKRPELCYYVYLFLLPDSWFLLRYS